MVGYTNVVYKLTCIDSVYQAKFLWVGDKARYDWRSCVYPVSYSTCAYTPQVCTHADDIGKHFGFLLCDS